jgi:mycothiol system anti-sigma-R factor
MIDCREAVRRMWAYLDHELEAKPVSEFEDHLETCRRCCGELEFSRHLRGMVADGEGTSVMPADVRARIETLLAGADVRPGQSK